MEKPFKVKDYMAANLVTFTPEMAVLDAIQVLVQKRISGGPVVDQYGNLIGVLSQKDCVGVALNAMYYGDAAGEVSEYMSRDVQTVEADIDLLEVCEMFLNNPYGRYPVIQNNRLVGQISRRDILKAILSLQTRRN